MENNEINNLTYPIKDGRRRHWALMPIQLDEKDLNQTAIELTIGKWVAVNIHLTGGYTHLKAPQQFDTYEECAAACRIHNSFHGWTEENIDHIFETSMIALGVHDGKVGEL